MDDDEDIQGPSREIKGASKVHPIELDPDPPSGTNRKIATSRPTAGNGERKHGVEEKPKARRAKAKHQATVANESEDDLFFKD